ncbi:hypothetical protein DOROTHY_56 [Mycobacterium phage Dorothy]|uniref:Helix-turn-helix DNA binding domain protein n=4 Tax=Cheoctovirus TaxID=1623281 RepID=A0A2S1PB27_9CAUD|nr:hypothetical protein PBI_ESTAVE1_61 [Mycobacterium phage Estave1]YP_009592031.1 hypothetical protein FDG65_gp056 [Mycobacterium phage Dorothy]YP_009955973.1 hypothetical protein I5H27_gp055 [Mycobacterium phage DillTech15]YP_009961461.1 hypothetical protein I5H80_gp056 [Mycobacterium phage Polka14]WAB10335.1 hypothetical protein PBI_REDBIRD_56 [Mycobacterium phage RedBird]AFQ97447.1 hypothetical protein DOROTHY_56 [Mycobacterium phage Dorothy]AIM40451.1 hypothetical protein PBI_ESTAVE1_61 
MSIDWFAVECAVNGTPMRLNTEERRMLVRRRPKLPEVELARRAHCTVRTIERDRAELPAAKLQSCPVCGEDAWVTTDGNMEAHPDRLFQECPLSETDWESRIAATVIWLSRRIRSGDSLPVWAYLTSLPETERTQLLMAALAGVPDVEDPFAWITELESAA